MISVALSDPAKNMGFVLGSLVQFKNIIKQIKNDATGFPFLLFASA